MTTARPAGSVDVQGQDISCPLALEQYVVVADYEKQGKHEVSLHQASTVQVVEKNEIGWWFVSTFEGQGWVPSAHLERVDGSVEDRVLSVFQQGEGDKYICVETYRAQLSDEISMLRGGMVEVLEKNLDGWWLVRYRDKTGRVPATNLTRTDTLKGRRLLSLQSAAENKNRPISPGTRPPPPPPHGPTRALSPADNGHTDRSRPILPKRVQAGTSVKRSRSNTQIPVKPSQPFVPGTSNDASITIKRTPSNPESSSYRVRERTQSASPQRPGAGAGKKSKFLSRNMFTTCYRGIEEEEEIYQPPPRKSSVATLVRPPRPAPPAVQIHYMTVADFHDQAGDGISFRAGQVVQVLEKNTGGWWYVRIGDRSGWAPSTYIETHKTPVAKPPAVNNIVPDNANSSEVQSWNRPLPPLPQTLYTNVDNPEVMPPDFHRVVAPYFGGPEQGEIGRLDVGQIVQVVLKDPAGWWYIKSDKEEGWTPSDYLEPISTCMASDKEENTYDVVTDRLHNVHVHFDERDQNANCRINGVHDIANDQKYSTDTVQLNVQEVLAEKENKNTHSNVLPKPPLPASKPSAAKVLGRASNNHSNQRSAGKGSKTDKNEGVSSSVEMLGKSTGAKSVGKPGKPESSALKTSIKPAVSTAKPQLTARPGPSKVNGASNASQVKLMRQKFEKSD